MDLENPTCAEEDFSFSTVECTANGTKFSSLSFLVGNCSRRTILSALTISAISWRKVVELGVAIYDPAYQYSK